MWENSFYRPSNLEAGAMVIARINLSGSDNILLLQSGGWQDIYQVRYYTIPGRESAEKARV